jgi:hypothetical protein
MRDLDLIAQTPRRDPIRGLIIGHAESGWMREARAWADVLLMAAVMVIAASMTLC